MAAKTTIPITVTAVVKLRYDPESKVFKQMVKDYQEVIDKWGTVPSILQHVAISLVRFGHERMIEGVGYVGVVGEKLPAKVWSGITVEKGYEDFETE